MGSAPAQRGGLSACDWLVTWDPHLALKNPSLQEHAWASTATQKPHGGLRNSKIEQENAWPGSFLLVFHVLRTWFRVCVCLRKSSIAHFSRGDSAVTRAVKREIETAQAHRRAHGTSRLAAAAPMCERHTAATAACGTKPGPWGEARTKILAVPRRLAGGLWPLRLRFRFHFRF